MADTPKIDLPNMDDMLKQAKEMQNKMLEIQKQLGDLTITGEAGAGMVKIEISGRYQVKKIHISDSLLEDEKDMLEDLLITAFNKAVEKVEKETKAYLGKMAQGLNIPKDAN